MTRYLPVRLAIVGCGQITSGSHLPAALRSPNVTVVALVDSDMARAEAVARSYSCPARLASKLEEVISDVEGVLIATPNHVHAMNAEVALNAGIPVLIEKPLTNTYASSLHLCQQANIHNTFISTGYKTRHHPAVMLMKSLLDANYFGPINSFRYEFGSRGGWAPISAYNLNRQQTGGGVLMVTGTHFLDRMLYWFGDPKIVDFRDDSFGGPDANCLATVSYSVAGNEFLGSIQLSKTFPLGNRFTMETEHFHVELYESESEEILAVPHSMSSLTMKLTPSFSLNRTAPLDYFQVQIDEFADCIRTGKTPLVDGWMGARSVLLVETLYAHRTQLSEPWMWYNNNGMCTHA